MPKLQRFGAPPDHANLELQQALAQVRAVRTQRNLDHSSRLLTCFVVAVLNCARSPGFQMRSQVDHLRRQNEQLQSDLAAAKDALWRRGWQHAAAGPVYSTEHMIQIHDEVVKLVAVVVVDHPQAMLTAATTRCGRYEVPFSWDDVQVCAIE